LIKVRLRFSKLFDARFISHLDLARCFSRAIRLSGLEAWYTEGFNPHLHITFALPLSLGFESICEAADIRLADDRMDQYIPERINRGLPYGIEVYDAGSPAHKASDIAWARYMIELGGGVDAAAISGAARRLAALGSIPAVKQGKNGRVSQVDIRPDIASMEASAAGGLCYIDAVIAAGSASSLNPRLILGALFADLGGEPDHQLVKRVNILDRDMESFV
jgi:radical SAM-linked protein